MEEHVGGALKIYAGDRRLRYRGIKVKPPKQNLRRSHWFEVKNWRHVPGADHPWRKWALKKAIIKMPQSQYL
jgi:hypothetical protein